MADEQMDTGNATRAEDYVSVLDAYRQAALSDDPSEEARLFSERRRIAAALSDDPLEMTRLAELRNDLMGQLKLDTESAADTALSSDEIERAKQVLFPGGNVGAGGAGSGENVIDIGRNRRALELDPVASYRHAHDRFLELVREGSDARSIHLVRRFRLRKAEEIAGDHANIVRIGSEAPGMKGPFLHDIGRSDLLGRDQQAQIDRLILDYMDLDERGRNVSHFGGAVAVEDDVRTNRLALAGRLADNPRALIELGQMGAKTGKPLQNRFYSDNLERVGSAAWTKEQRDAYAQFVRKFDDQLGPKAGDPVARYVELQKSVSEAELSKHPHRIAFLREYARRTAGEIYKDQEKVGELVRNHPEHKHAAVRDAKQSASRQTRDQERAAEAERALNGEHAAGLTPSANSIRQARDSNTRFGADAARTAERRGAGEASRGVKHHSESGGSAPGATIDGVHFDRTGDFLAFPAKEWSRRNGSLGGLIAQQAPKTRGALQNHLRSPDTLLFALPLTPFSSGGAVDYELKTLAVANVAKLRRMWENTTNAMISLNKSGLNNENDKEAHDMLQMGIRAMSVTMAKRKLMRPEELAEFEKPFLSKKAQILDPAHRRDPQGLIQKGDEEARKNMLHRLGEGAAKVSHVAGHKVGEYAKHAFDKMLDAVL